MKKLFFAAVMALAVCPLFAQEEGMEPPHGRENRRQGGRNGNRRGNGMFFDPSAWEKAQAELRKKDPKACEEIDRLAKTNLMAAMQKMREVMQKENISLPGGRGNRRRGFGGGEGGGFGNPGRMPPPMMRDPGNEERAKALESVKAKFPQEYTAYEKQLESAAGKKAEALEIEIKAEKTIASLAKKARVTIPESMSSYHLKEQYLRNKYKSLFEKVQSRGEAEKLLAKLAQDENLSLGERPQMRSGHFQMRPEGEETGNRPSAGRSNPMAMMRELDKRYPEEMKEIRLLHRQDPGLAKKKMQSLIEKYNRESAGK